ncbi:MAG: ABC transporter substrate-binding protein [Clostridiales bacterium]|nr:ABC transporter substrate-binding protein [Clostridiales bacterium]OPZ67380.1 MAG: Leucine-, isoleucine-, valine-, threonine-, and alanine-binding protein precursor [Firmicutes bacterium ADurb.Bin467]
MKKVLSLVLVALLALATLAIPAMAEGETFRIGTYFGITGGNSAYGIECRNAVRLAVDYVNQNGGFNGQKVELVEYDTQCSAEEAVKVATKLITEDKVDAAIGSMNSGEVLAAAPYFNEAGIYHFGCGTAASWMKEDWPYVFRAAMNNAFAVPIAANLMVDLGYKTIAIFNGQEEAALATANIFEETFKGMGIEVVARESYDAGDTDYSAQITKMMSANPDCILISVIGETGGPLVRQLRQNGYTGIILNKESFMDSQIEIAGAEASNYIAFANPYVTYKSVDDCDIPYMKEFLQRYLDAYGQMVKTDSAYRGWDTVMVMWEASKIAGSNESNALVEATHKVVIEGLGGTLDYTSGNREGYNTFNSFILVNGKNVLFKTWLEEGGYEAYLAETGNAK